MRPVRSALRMKRFTSARSGSTPLVTRSAVRARADIHSRQRTVWIRVSIAPLFYSRFYAGLASRPPALASRRFREVDALKHQEQLCGFDDYMSLLAAPRDPIAPFLETF